MDVGGDVRITGCPMSSEFDVIGIYERHLRADPWCSSALRSRHPRVRSVSGA